MTKDTHIEPSEGSEQRSNTPGFNSSTPGEASPSTMDTTGLEESAPTPSTTDHEKDMAASANPPKRPGIPSVTDAEMEKVRSFDSTIQIDNKIPVLHDSDIKSITSETTTHMTPRAIKAFIAWLCPLPSGVVIHHRTRPDKLIPDEKALFDGLMKPGELGKRVLDDHNIGPTNIKDESTQELWFPLKKDLTWYLVVINSVRKTVKLVTFARMPEHVQEEVEAQVHQWFKSVWKRWLSIKAKNKTTWKVVLKDSQNMQRDNRVSGALLCLEMYQMMRKESVSINTGDIKMLKRYVAAKAIEGAEILKEKGEKKKKSVPNGVDMKMLDTDSLNHR